MPRDDDTTTHDDDKGGSNGPTSFIPAFEDFLARKGMPRPYLPLYSVLAHRLAQQYGIDKLRHLTPTQAEKLIAQNAKEDDSPHTIANKQRVIRAMVRYLTNGKHR